MKYLYRYPQAAYPYDQLVLNQSRPKPPGIRIRTDQHRRLRRGPLLRRVRGIRQGIARGYPGPNQCPQSGAGARGNPRAADALVPQSVVVGPGQSAAIAASCRRQCRRGEGEPGRAGRALSLLRWPGVTAVHRKRNQREAAVRRAEPDALRQGRHQQFHRPRTNGCRESGEDRDQGRGALSPDRPGRKVRDRSAAVDARSAGCPGEDLREGQRRVRQTF